MSNVNASRIKLRTLINSSAFKRGWDDYRNGKWTEVWDLKPPRGRPDVSPAFTYERGRMMALWALSKGIVDTLPPSSKVDFRTAERSYRTAQEEGFIR